MTVTGDIQEWATFLREVVSDRCAVGAYCVNTIAVEDFTALQRLALRFEAGDFLKLLL